MICTNCQTENQDSAKFCAKCGKLFGLTTAQPTVINPVPTVTASSNQPQPASGRQSVASNQASSNFLTKDCPNCQTQINFFKLKTGKGINVCPKCNTPLKAKLNWKKFILYSLVSSFLEALISNLFGIKMYLLLAIGTGACYYFAVELVTDQ